MFFSAASDHVNDLSAVYYSSIPLMITLVPIAAGLFIYFIKDSFINVSKGLSITVSFLALAGVLFLMPMVLTGTVHQKLFAFMQLNLFFKADLIGWIFSLIITLVWLLATLFSFTYMDFEHNRRRYYSILTLTLGATLGVVLAGDLFTLFLFFELMTLSSFILVIHEQDSEAMQAGLLYLYLGIAGGLCLLFAIMMVYSAAGTVDLVPLLDHISVNRTLIYLLFLVGFGVKAGLVPLHVWLPQAHPVAPSPASALLSGILIKTGAYGILRVSLIIYSSPNRSVFSECLYSAGSGLMWTGIVTMLAGAVMALLQGNMKRILAYSSVSQIGYIATAIGAAMLMGSEGAMGFAGAIYHVVNHAFFKAGLFMIVGTVYMYTHELELSRLGGLLKKMPLVSLAFIIAAFGIAGIPGFNGFSSKTLIHDALLVAIKFEGTLSLEMAEKIFTLTSALTICYFIKLFRGIFLGPIPEKIDRDYKLTASTSIVLSLFIFFITFIGLFPNFILERFIVPAAVALKYEGYAMDHLYHFHFFEWEPLSAMLVVLVIAMLIYIPGQYRGWFSWKAPWWLSIYSLIYKPLTSRLMVLTCWTGQVIDSSVDSAYNRSGGFARNVCRTVGNFDSGLDKFYHKWGSIGKKLADSSRDMDEGLDRFYRRTGQAARKMADKTADIDSALDNAYKKTGDVARKLADQSSDIDRSINKIYDKAGEKTRDEIEKHLSNRHHENEKDSHRRWTTKNLSIDNLLLVVVLGIVLLIIFYFGRS